MLDGECFRGGGERGNEEGGRKLHGSRMYPVKCYLMARNLHKSLITVTQALSKGSILFGEISVLALEFLG